MQPNKAYYGPLGTLRELFRLYWEDLAPLVKARTACMNWGDGRRIQLRSRIEEVLHYGGMTSFELRSILLAGQEDMDLRSLGEVIIQSLHRILCPS